MRAAIRTEIAPRSSIPQFGLYAFSRFHYRVQFRRVATRPAVPIFRTRSGPIRARLNSPHLLVMLGATAACALGLFGTGRHTFSTNSSLNQWALVAFVLKKTVLAQIARGLASQVLQLRPALQLAPFAIVAIRPVKDAHKAREP
jgi:hypothetical protein